MDYLQITTSDNNKYNRNIKYLQLIIIYNNNIFSKKMSLSVRGKIRTYENGHLNIPSFFSWLSLGVEQKIRQVDKYFYHMVLLDLNFSLN